MSVPARQQELDALADSVAAAALSVPGVTRLHTGTFGEVAVYLAGRRVDGVRIRPEETEVHVVLSPAVEIGPAASAIRTAVAAVVDNEISVFVEDLDVDLSGPRSEDG